MSNTMKASEDIKFLASKFKEILEVAEVLGRIGSLEQAERDAGIRKDAAYKAADEATATLKGRLDELSMHEGFVEDKKYLASKIEKDAAVKASSLVDAAIAKANDIVSKANNSKDLIVKEAQELSDKNNSLKKSLADGNAQLGFINDQIAEAKRKIAAFGGA